MPIFIRPTDREHDRTPPQRRLAPLFALGLACASAVYTAPAAAQAVVAPVARAAALAAALNTTTTIDLAPFIAGAGITGVSVAANAAHGAVSVNGTRVSYRPALNYFGPDSFTYIAYGAGGASAPAQIAVTVAGRPDPAQDAGVNGMLATQAGAAQRFSKMQSGVVLNRLQTLQLGAAGKAVAAPDAAQAGAPPSTWSGVDAWLAAGDAFGNRKQDGVAAGAAYGSDSLTFGFDRRFGDRHTLGMALGYARERADVGLDGSANRAHSTQLSIYGQYRPTEQWTLDGALGYGNLQMQSTRHVVSAADVARASRSGDYAFASLSAAYDYRSDKVVFAPYARLDAATHKLDAALESGAGLNALSYSSLSTPSAQAALGVRIKTMHEAEFGWVLPRVRLEWQRDLKDAPDNGAAYADGGAAYRLPPSGAKRTTRTIGLGSDIVLLSGMTLSLDYQYDNTGGQDKNQSIQFRLSSPLDGRGAPPALVDESAFVPSTLKIPVELTAATDDNVARASDDADKLRDTVYGATLRKGAVFSLDDHVQLEMGGFLGAEKWRRYTGLDRAYAGGQAELRYKASNTAPAFGVLVNATFDSYASDQRDGRRYSAGVTTQYALSPSLGLSAAVLRNLRYANSAVFEGADRAARVSLDYAPNHEGTWYAGAEYRQGDIVSSGTPALGKLDISKVYAKDDAFLSRQFSAYRFDGKTALFTLGYSKPFGPRNALDLAWHRAQSRPDRSPGFATPPYRYVDNQLSLAYLSSF